MSQPEDQDHPLDTSDQYHCSAVEPPPRDNVVKEPCLDDFILIEVPAEEVALNEAPHVEFAEGADEATDTDGHCAHQFYVIDDCGIF